MGTDIHAFVEYADYWDRNPFSGNPDQPALLFGQFWLNRDYRLFDTLGDGRNSQMNPEDVGPRALFPPRGVPADISLVVAREYYDLVIDSHPPYPMFWPAHGGVSVDQAQQWVRGGRSHLGTVVQKGYYGTTPPRTWQVVSKEHWHTPSWLTGPEIRQSLEHQRLPLEECGWDFRALMRCLSDLEKQLGHEQVRLVFWFDS
jgi:hypothetical protein